MPISEESGLSILCQQSAGDFLESFFNIDEEETITLPSMLEISKEALKNVECCLSSTWVDGRISCTERIVLAYPGIDESAEKKITISPESWNWKESSCILPDYIRPIQPE